MFCHYSRWVYIFVCVCASRRLRPSNFMTQTERAQLLIRFLLSCANPSVFLVPRKILTTRLWNLFKESISEFHRSMCCYTLIPCDFSLCLAKVAPPAPPALPALLLFCCPTEGNALFVFMRERWLNASLL